MELFSLLLLEPGLAACYISEHDTGNSGFLMLLCAVVSFITGSFVLFAGGGIASIGAMIFFIPANFIMILFGLWVLSSFYNYFAELFGGPGRSSYLFRVLPYSSLPFLFTTPAVLIAAALFPAAVRVLYIPILMVFVGWSLYLQVRLIERIYGISSFASFAACLLPWVVMFMFILALPLMIAAAGVGLAVIV